MEFAFTEEQAMIRDTAAAFLAEVSDRHSTPPDASRADAPFVDSGVGC